MISQDAEDSHRGMKSSKHLSAGLAILGRAEAAPEWRPSHVVSSQNDYIGSQSVGDLYRSPDDSSAARRVVMKIAELRDGQAIKLFGQACEEDLDPFHKRPAWFYKSALGDQSSQGRPAERDGKTQELTSAKQRVNQVHSLTLTRIQDFGS